MEVAACLRSVCASSAEFVMGPVIKLMPGRACLDTTRLVEEGGDAVRGALVANRTDPGGFHVPGAGAALAAEDHSVNSGKVEGAEVFQEGFDGKEPNGSQRSA